MRNTRTPGGFRFRLEALRHLRDWEKKQRSVELAQHVARVQALRTKLTELKQEQQDEWARMQSSGADLDPAFRLLYGAYAERARAATIACRVDIAAAESDVAKARWAWGEAEQKLTLLDNLRDRDARAFERANARREQAELDEIAARQPMLSISQALSDEGGRNS